MSGDSRDSRESTDSRESGNTSDSRKLATFRLHASSVSRALWPASVRRCVETGRAAQRRRLIRMKRLRWSERVEGAPPERECARRIYALSLLVIATLAGGGVILITCVLHPWTVLLILAALWLLTAAMAARLLSHEVRSMQAFRKSPPPQAEVQQSGPGEAPAFPLTPVPATPLIRVLETIDLSSADVEHFLGASSPDNTDEQNNPVGGKGPYGRDAIYKSRSGADSHEVRDL
jgi:hypothetical protein